MSILTFPSTGDTFFTLQYNGDILDAATAIDSWILQPHQDYPKYCYFNVGSEAGLVDGITLTSASGAVIKVGHVALTGGALGSDTGAGVLFFREVSGNIISGEALNVGATLYCNAASGALDCPLNAAVALFVAVETNTIRYALGGATPSNAAATPASFGTPVYALGYGSFIGWKDVSQFKMIHAASGSNATVTVNVMF